MNDEQLLRYSRQIVLPEIEFDGQQTLLNSHVLIIGLGGLGSPVSLYLTAAGVGKLTLVDDDSVELSNLQRQIVHKEHNIGQAKVDSAAENLKALNKDIELNVQRARLEQDKMTALIKDCDVVVDCSDNFATRFLINEITQQAKVPLVSGAAIRMEGQVTVYDARQQGSACYQCVYKKQGELEQSCSNSGVLSPLLGIIGSVQALEVIKLLTGTGETLAGRLMLLDASTMSWQTIKLKQDPDCPVCQRAK